VAKLWRKRNPLSLVEKDRVIEEIWTRSSGWGARAAAAGSHRERHSGHHAALVYVERGGKLYRTPVEFKDDAHLLRIIEKVVSRVGRRWTRVRRWWNARLPDGSRVNAAIPPVAVDGPLLSIRRFGRHALKGEDW